MKRRLVPQRHFLYVLEIFSIVLALLAFFLLHRPTLVFSLMFFIKIKKAIKMADDHAFDAFYEFNGDCFYRKAKVNDEQVSEAKINYSDITCYKVSKSYIYLVLFSKNYYPVDKDDQLEKFLISKNIVRK